MTNILEKLKADRLVARKASSPTLVSYYNFLISEIEKIGKNDGNRETTNDEAVVAVKKMISNVLTTMEAKNVHREFSSDSIVLELAYLESLLPAMISDEVVDEYVKELLSQGADKGTLMKALKAKFGVLVDLKRVSANLNKG